MDVPTRRRNTRRAYLIHASSQRTLTVPEEIKLGQLRAWAVGRLRRQVFAGAGEPSGMSSCGFGGMAAVPCCRR